MLTSVLIPPNCRYHLKDTVLGKIYFLLVRIKIKHMEIAIIRRESTGAGANATPASDTITKFEVMDGAPVRGTDGKQTFRVVKEKKVCLTQTHSELIPPAALLHGYNHSANVFPPQNDFLLLGKAKEGRGEE